MIGLRRLASHAIRLRNDGHDIRLYLFRGLPSFQYFRFDDRMVVGLLTAGGKSRERITLEFNLDGSCRRDYCDRLKQISDHFGSCLESVVTAEVDVEATTKSSYPAICEVDSDRTQQATILAEAERLDPWTRQELLARITWRKSPEFLRPGRTARFVSGLLNLQAQGRGTLQSDNFGSLLWCSRCCRGRASAAYRARLRVPL